MTLLILSGFLGTIVGRRVLLRRRQIVPLNAEYCPCGYCSTANVFWLNHTGRNRKFEVHEHITIKIDLINKEEKR